MPLDYETRMTVVSYILRDVVPRTVQPHPPIPMEWFIQQFSFVEDVTLQTHLGEAFYQARFVGRVREALALKGGFNHAFTKYQIVLYASIYEALIDYILRENSGNPIVRELFTEIIFRPRRNALSSKTKILYADETDECELVPCRPIVRERKLQEIQFDQRVDTVVHLGVFPEADAPFMKALYKSRNNVHLQSSANKEFKPDNQESSEAFRLLFRFIQHLQAWTIRHPTDT
jgi:hypothetical protein